MIFAHIEGPSFLNEIRTFDVPLLVFISSYLGRIKTDNIQSNDELLFYISSRIKRIVFPTWFFLIVYFLIRAICGKFYSPSYYLFTFLLTKKGLGYVWIMLVYIYSSLFVILFKKNRISFFSIITLYIFFEFSLSFGFDNSLLLDETLFTIIPYGLICFFGYNFVDFSNRKIKKLILIFTLIFITCLFFYKNSLGYFLSLQDAKYPPRIYYLSYGLLVTFILFYFLQKKDIKIFKNKYIIYCSKNSIWIYLWHILFLKLYEISGFTLKWYILFIVIYLSSILTTYIINNKLLKNRI